VRRRPDPSCIDVISVTRIMTTIAHSGTEPRWLLFIFTLHESRQPACGCLEEVAALRRTRA
jgi:hypothetical protein